MSGYACTVLTLTLAKIVTGPLNHGGTSCSQIELYTFSNCYSQAHRYPNPINQGINMTRFTQEIDARNENCPVPVLKVKQALKSMARGEVLHVMATDPDAVKDINILLDALEDQLIESSQQANEYHFYIKKS